MFLLRAMGTLGLVTRGTLHGAVGRSTVGCVDQATCTGQLVSECCTGVRVCGVVFTGECVRLHGTVQCIVKAPFFSDEVGGDDVDCDTIVCKQKSRLQMS